MQRLVSLTTLTANDSQKDNEFTTLYDLEDQLRRGLGRYNIFSITDALKL